MEKKKKRKNIKWKELSNSFSSTSYILFLQVIAMPDCIETKRPA